MPTRSPPSTRTSASAKATIKTRSSLVSSARCGDEIPWKANGPAKSILYARLPIPARAHRDDRRGAERRQSTRCAGSPNTKRRYCQKFSPEPARRRPCSPWIMVAAMRRASRISRGMVAARVRPCPVARGSTAAVSFCVSRGSIAMRGYPSRAFSRSITAGMVSPSARAAKVSAIRCLSTGSASARHVVDRRREPALKQRTRTHRQHQRLAGARAGTPGDQLADIADCPGPDAPSAPARGSLRRPTSPTGSRRTSRCAPIVVGGHRRLGFTSSAPVVSNRMRRSASRSG